MNKNELMILALLVIFNSCDNKQSPERPYSGPKVTETNGYVVPMDSMEKPVVTTIDYSKLKTIKAGKPKMVPVKSNVYPAGKPKIIKAGKPIVCTPGQDTFLLPKKVVAIFNTVLAETPEVVLAKEASSKEYNPYSFSSFGPKNGLKSPCIVSIFEDKAGNIWIALCDQLGVSRFDGKYFTNFDKNNGLHSIRTIMEDKKGTMWFGAVNGVLKYDGKYYTNFINPEIPVNTVINTLYEDTSGNIWMGTNGYGLLKFDGNLFTSFTQKEGLPNNFINSIVQDKNDNIWLGTDSGLSKFDGTSFFNYTEKEGLSNSIVYSVLEDKEGSIWIGTYGGGVCKYDGESFEQYTEKEGLSNNFILSIIKDRRDNLWFATESNGITMYDGIDFTHFAKKAGFIDLGLQLFQTMIEDKHGKFWFSTFEDGLIKYSGNQFVHLTKEEGFTGNGIGTILEDKNKNLWFGCYGGMVKMDQNFVAQIKKDQGLIDDRIWSMIEDKLGHLWLGTAGGLLKYDGSKFTKVSPKTGLYEWTVYSLLEDKAGNIWVGTDDGLHKYNGNMITSYTTKNGLLHNIIFAIMEDKKGNIWLGTEIGISKLTQIKSNDSEQFSITNFTEKDGLGNGTVRSFLEDTNGYIYIGTGGGLSKIVLRPDNDKMQYEITNYTIKDGLSSNEIKSIYQDISKNLWIGTLSGLNMLTSQKQGKLIEKVQSKSITDSDVFFKNYGQNDGFFGIGVLGGKTIHEDIEGKLWIGSYGRLTIYDPKGESSDSMPPNIQITDVNVFNENIDWNDLQNKKDTTITLGNGVGLKNFDYDSTGTWYGLPQSLSLAYNNNYITFKFVSITQNQPHKIKYKYQLIGLEENWSALTDKNEAQYGNLPYGHYTFMVKSMNGDGLWSQSAEYMFTIRPPWWHTWWAYGIYLLLISYAGWKLHQYQKAKTIAKEREKARERELEHAKEIEKAYTELKSTQAQLIQSEKMASLGELTAGIAHEIQNPLNFVNNFSEVSNELMVEMVDEVDKGNYDEVKAIAIDVQQNLEKINHHGKRASSIVKSMLEHSRTSSGKKEPTDINALADEYLKLAYQSLRAKDKDFNATLETNFDTTLPKINVVSQDIGRVILNLITNAFYAVNEKSKVESQKKESNYKPTVSITTRLTADSQQLIAIKDNGSGIPDAIKDKIFQPFFTTKPTGQGTGLGLSLAYDIVKAHGGEIKVETKEGEGCVFVVKLNL